MKRIIELLNNANHAYYNLNRPIMTDTEYDKLYDDLLKLENETGIVLSNSPTQNVGYEVVSKLEKVNHDIPMLSLNKTKDLDELEKFIGDHDCILSLKLDGLATKIEFKDNRLVKGATRGSGTIGELITHNIPAYQNVPLTCSQDVTVVGESIITSEDFESINDKLPEEEKYSNSRNLVSGSVRQLDSKICKQRNVRFIAYGIQNENGTKQEHLRQLRDLGFDVVPFIKVNKNNYIDGVSRLKLLAEELGYPIDGLVCTYNDLSYGKSLGNTSKFPRHSIALKSSDSEYETIFRGVETNTTRTGIVSLVGLFDPVDIDGAMVSKASLHNVDIFEDLELGVGDTITVRRANMVIPQVTDNLTRSGTYQLPDKCPSCGERVTIQQQKEARFLYCPNDNCKAKLVQKVVHFASRDAMNITGLSEATAEKFIELGFIKDLSDIYSLENFEEKIVKMEGFGEKSYKKLIQSINTSKDTDFYRFLYGLGIPNVGRTAGKALSEHFNADTFIKLTIEDLRQIKGLGQVLSMNILKWVEVDKNKELYTKLLSKGISFKKAKVAGDLLSGKTFVVTGKVNHFKNRKELQAKIEDLGGKVTGSVSSSTNFLLNNDIDSSSSKNKSAKKLGIPIISEEDFLHMINK